MNDGFVNRKYEEFYDKNGYIPNMFNPYNCSEINDFAPTITTQCGSTTSSATVLIKEEYMGKLNQIGYVDKNAQGQRVYDLELSPTLKSNGGGISGSSGLHIIGNNKLIHKGVDGMWNNNLEKFNFKMEEIRIADFFSGIGALHQALKELGVPVRVTNLSEIDIDATISYAAVHIDNFKDLEFEYPSTEEMRQWLIDRNIGYSYEKDKSSVSRMKVDKLKLAYKASVLLNNLGDISKIDYHRMEDFDMFNLSFSCTDLSNSGKQRGMKNPDGTPTRSGLYVYGIETVRVKKPKYIMIENVKGLIQKKFIDDFYSIISELEEIGYNCYYPIKEDKKGNKLPTCLNSKDFGIAQNRERIFVIAIRKDIDTKTFEFPIGKDHGIRLKHMLEDQVDEKYYLSDEIQKKFKATNHNPEMVLTNGAIRGRYNSDGKIEQQLELRNDGVTNTLTTVEKDNVIVEDTNKLNMLGMLDIKGNDCIRRVYGDDGLCPTITTMGGEIVNLK